MADVAHPSSVGQPRPSAIIALPLAIVTASHAASVEQAERNWQADRSVFIH
jgi:hypothetical protein